MSAHGGGTGRAPFEGGDPGRDASDGGIAAFLIDSLTENGLIHVARSEGRAARIAAATRALAPSVQVLHLPGWDCLPYDRVSPSPEIMGARLRVLRTIAKRREAGATAGLLLIASVEAAMQRVPAAAPAGPVVPAGASIDPALLTRQLSRMGYAVADLVETPGTCAIRGEVIDVFPPDDRPVRIEHENGQATALRRFDPLTQRSTEELDRVELTPASELVLPEPDDTPTPRPPGLEHALPEFTELASIFELLPAASVNLEPEVDTIRGERQREMSDAFRSRLAAYQPDAGLHEPVEPSRLHLDEGAWSAAVADRRTAFKPNSAPLSAFGEADDPETAFIGFAADRARNGSRILLAGPRRVLRALSRRLARKLETAVVEVEDLAAAQALPPGSVALLETRLAAGFLRADLVVLAASDLGVATDEDAAGDAQDSRILAGAGLRPGDAVVHWDRGVGVLRGVEPVDTGCGRKDCLRIDYARGSHLLVPFDELDRLWRYGDAEGVGLDHLNTPNWEKRRAEVEAQIAEAADALARRVAAREAAAAPVLGIADAGAHARFASGFGYHPTRDQEAAIEAVTADLASGRPMDRLVCGDVGFGKTEVALRAAAIAALAGKQVAVLAPTTVLARQHLETFRARFARIGIEVGSLSRLSTPAEARRTRAQLAEGSLRIVVGTHALAARGVRFHDLGLLVIDEEQRFGARQKAALRRMGREGVHVLTLTATPIPRTLQTAVVGLQDLSIIATPPAHRQPIRTETMPFDEIVLREALAREHRRGGQSFVVCPRVEDIAPLRRLLERVVPDLGIDEAHGGLAPEAVDEAMLGFACGKTNILLATNIIETGLDVPRANTMIVFRAELFGLAQLHQLRGRVGRGRIRGAVYLMSDPAKPPTPAAAKRLRTLEAFDRVGAGFAVSARDLDLRGAGDLLGESQAGHVRLIGLTLYQHLLDEALRRARRRRARTRPAAGIVLDIEACIPPEYIPDETVRVDILTRLAALARDGQGAAVEALEDEIRDRFGPLPAPVEALLEHTVLRTEAARLGITRLDAGPAAIAATFAGEPPEAPAPLERHNERLLLRRESRDPAAAVAHIRELLALLDAPAERRAA